MMRLFGLLLVVAWVVAASSEDEFEGDRRIRSLRAFADQYNTRKLAEQLVMVMNHQDLGSMMRMISAKSLLSHFGDLPCSGLYKGHRGALEFAESCSKMFETSNAECRVKKVSEDSGNAIIMCKRSGRFTNSNKTLSDSKSLLFVRFRLGQIEHMNAVDLDPRTVHEAYHTNAELAYNKMAYQVAERGLTGDIMNMVSDDISIKVYGFNTTSFRGKEGLSRLVSEMESISNKTAKCKTMYSDNTTLIQGCLVGCPKALTKLTMAVQMMPAGRIPLIESPMFFYSRKNFTDDGKLAAVEYLPGKYMSPHELYRMRRESGSGSLPSLISSLVDV